MNAQGGTGGTYTYQWNTVPLQNTDTAFALVDGTYSVTVIDSNGCFDTASVVLVDPLLFTVALTGTNVSCFNVCDGTAATTLTNGISPFSYSWDDPSGQSTDSIFGLCDTTAVTVTVTDNMGCIAIGSIAITEPALLVATENLHGDVSCFGGNDGFSGVNVVGGTGPYNYLWELGGAAISTNQAPVNLIAGNYLVTVTDGNGCTHQINVIITEPAALTAIATPSDADCSGASTGSAFVTVAAGTGTAPYTYLWTGVGSGLQTTDTAFSLPANTAPGYTVTVTDSLGCIFVINGVIVDEPTPLTLTPAAISSTCGLANGTASVTVGGGVLPYSYNWNTVPAQGTAIASNVAAANYTVYVTDGNGCTDSTTANVTDLGSPTITIPTSTNVTCQGAGDGDAQSVTVGGTAPFSYVWNTGNVADTLANVTGLNGQVYSVTVTDANGCSSGATVTISENPSVTTAMNAPTHVSCNGLADGTASVIAQGGAGGTYSYLWNGGLTPTTAANSGLAANTYFVTVTDSNGCSINDTVIITQPAVLTVTEDAITHVLCNGDATGSITILGAGGTLPYVTYAWTPNISAGPIAAGIPAGPYSYTITDANGCTATGNSVVNEPTQLAATTATVSSTCGLLNGEASVTVTPGSGTAPYLYSWNTTPVAQLTATATGLAASLYTVTVTDDNGCFINLNAIVTDLPGPIIDSMIVTHVSCNGFTDGTATVYASNGALPYSYQWGANANNQGAQTATDLGASPPLYTVTVTDLNGCTSTSIAQISEPSILQAFINAPDTVCYNEDIQLFSNAGGGTIPYVDFTWTGGLTQSGPGQGPFLDTLTTSTVYNVEVTDDNGCQASTQHIVYVRAQPNFDVAPQTICQGEVATLTPANLTGGDPSNSFTFFWMEADTSVTPNTYTNLGAFNPYTDSPSDSTVYAVYVDNVCATSDTVLTAIFVYDSASVGLLYGPNADCPPFMVGFKADSLGGPGPDQGNSYVWDFGNTYTGSGDSTFFNYLNTGTYDVTLTVTTANGCISVVTEPGWVEVYPVPVADFTTDPNPPTVTLLNPVFDFINQSTDNPINEWDFGDGTGTSLSTDPSYTYLDTGYYQVTLMVENQPYGCRDTAQQTVRIRPDFFFAIPNSFTPDGDGLNDIFFPGSLILTGGTDRNYNFFIFDRWGELIWEAHQMSEGWDGTYKGKVVQNGTYVWRVEVTDLEGTVHKHTGHVNALR